MKKKWRLGIRILSLLLVTVLLINDTAVYAAPSDGSDEIIINENEEDTVDSSSVDSFDENDMISEDEADGSELLEETLPEQDDPPEITEEPGTDETVTEDVAEEDMADEESHTVLILEEDISQRTSNVKIFQNEDHSYTAAVYPDAVHYEENGEWKEIDNSLADAGEEDGTQYIGNQGNLLDVKFSKKSNGKKLVKVKLDEFQVSWGLKDARKVDAGQKEHLTSETIQVNAALHETDPVNVEPAENQEEPAENMEETAENAGEPADPLDSEAADILSECPSAAQAGVSLEQAEKQYGNRKNNNPLYNTKEGILPEEQEKWNSTNDPEEETLDSDYYDAVSEKNAQRMEVENLSSNVVYEEILPGIDLEYILVSQRMKENIVIKNKEAQNSFVFQYQLHGMEPELKDQNILFKDGDGNVVFETVKPYAYDSSGAVTENIEVSLTKGKGKKCEITVTLDEDWIKDENRAFPVILDPTVTTTTKATAIDDTYAASAYPTSNYVYRDYLKTGVDSGGAVCRSFLGFTLPELKASDMVIYARLNMCVYQSSSEQTTVEVHNSGNVVGKSTAITWRTMPDCDSEALDYAVFTPAAGEWVYFDITTWAQEVYRNGKEKNGLMLKAAQEDGQETYFISSDCSVTAGRPSITLLYINNNGLEDYWTYHEQDVGRAGTGYINDFNGNLVFVHDTMNTTGDQITANLSHVYNLNDRSTDLGYGYGWRLNYHQTVKSITVDETEYKEYTDGDGTIHYFKYDRASSVWKDESGLDLKMTVNSGSSTERYVIQDKDNNKLKFNSSGYLVQISRKDTSWLNIIYSNNRITKITDGAVRDMTFTYDSSGRLAKVTHPSGQEKKFTYTDGKLTGIEDVDGETMRYTYDSSRRLLSACDIDGYTICYEYWETGSKYVSKVIEKNGETQGQILEVAVFGSETRYTDSKQRMEYYQFNNAGHTIGIKNSEGQAQTAKYLTTGRNNNKISKLSSLQSMAVNLLKNPNLDNKSSWSFTNENAVITLDTRKENARVGNNAFSISSNSNVGKAGCRQNVTVESGKTYTFSAYAKAAEKLLEQGLLYAQVVAQLSSGAKLYSSETDYYKTEDGWYRLITSITIPEDSTVSSAFVYAGIYGKGTAYLDCFQFEEGSSASKHNLIQNGDFRNGLTGYTTTGTSLYDRVRMAGEVEEGLQVTYQVGTVTTDYLNMRTGPGTSYTSVTSLSTGASVTIIGQGTAADGKVWYYTYCIKNGQVYSGYMSSTYIQLTSAKRTATKAVVDATDLNVRKGAGRGYDSITTIDRNNTLYILDTSLASTGQYWALVYFEKSGTKYVGYVLDVYIYGEMFESIFDRNPVDQMDDKVYHMTGNPAMVKKLTQTLEISGQKGDVFAGGVWSCGAATAAKDSRAYGLEVQFVALDGSKETFTSTFEAINSGWKYLYDVFIPTKNFVRINVSCVYNYQGNMVLFDGLGFYREDFAASYVYDNEGNVTSVKNNASKQSQFEYNGKNELTKYIDPKGNNFTYGYDIYQNLASAASAESVKYTFDHEYGVLFHASTVDQTNNLSIDSELVRTYVYNFNYVEGITDALGNTISYEYNTPQEGLMTKATDARENSVDYTYENDSRKLKSVTSAYNDGFNSGTSSISYTYENDNLKTITYNDSVYTFTYDGFGNNTGIQVAGNQLVTRQYESNNGNLSSVQYGNDYTYLYTYDDLDRVTELRLKDPDNNEYILYQYEYDQDGNLSTVYDILEDIGRETIVTRYYYDMSGRLIYSCNNQDEDYRYTYDLNNNLIKVEQGNQFREFGTEYTYDKDNRETKTKTLNRTFATEYDGLARIKNQSWNTTTAYEIVYEYQAGAGGAGSTSSQISKITAGGEETLYEYDANENITKITTSDGSISYTYDELDQLVREDNSMTQQTIGYVYDAGGNLLEKRTFAYLPDKTITELKSIAPSDTIYYTYDSEYKDKLVSYNGNAITYDAICNPLIYRGMTFNWEKGRELNQIQKDGKTYTYRYNVNGIRNRKYLEDETVLYQVDGSLIVGEQKVDNAGNLAYELGFTYDSAGNILTMVYNGNEYYYAKNLQGDVVGILNSDGTEVVSYQYDTWGKLLAVEGNLTIGNVNPFRYRGYYYDTESGLYYVSSRYYDPEVGRFVNPDVYIKTPTDTLLSTNMFAYCENNPVNKFDPTGDFAFTATLGGIALWKIAVALLGTVTVFGMANAIIKNPPKFPAISIPKIEAKPKAKVKDKAKGIAPPKPRRDPVHHIVAKADPRAAESRKILRDVGIEPVTDSRNLVILPQSYHASLHTTAYHNYVTKKLKLVAGDKKKVEATLISLKAEILANSVAGIRWD